MSQQKDLFIGPPRVDDESLRQVVEIYQEEFAYIKNVVGDLSTLFECNSDSTIVYTTFCHLRTRMIHLESSINKVLKLKSPQMSSGDLLRLHAHGPVSRPAQSYRPDRG